MTLSNIVENTVGSPKVLIVDDDPAVLEFLGNRCSELGLEVKTAPNGLHALVMHRQHPADVLIVDVYMPKLDGLSLCESLLEPSRKSIEVIVVSGYSNSENTERWESLGVRYVDKGPECWEKVRSALIEIFPRMTVEIDDPKSRLAEVRTRPVILIVDDDPNVGEILTSRLKKCGVDAKFATNGAMGYHFAKRHRPSVILSDCSMPGTDINFLLWRLRSTPGTEKIPVFAMSEYNLDKATKTNLADDHCGWAGVERFFKKPLNIDELFLAFQDHCILHYKSTIKIGWAARWRPIGSV